MCQSAVPNVLHLKNAIAAMVAVLIVVFIQVASACLVKRSHTKSCKRIIESSGPLHSNI